MPGACGVVRLVRPLRGRAGRSRRRLDLVAGTDAWLTAQLCAVGMRLEADRCFSARRRRARSEETAARQRAREIAATAEAVGVQEGTTGAWLDQADAEFARIAGGDTDIPQLERWSAVRDRWRALGHWYDEAYAEVRWSEAKLSAGSRREAETALRRSASVADDLGAAPLAALVAGVRLRGGLDSLPTVAEDGLTPREREILSWVARGASNRDIAEHCLSAQRLYLSMFLPCCASSGCMGGATWAPRQP